MTGIRGIIFRTTLLSDHRVSGPNRAEELRIENTLNYLRIGEIGLSHVAQVDPGTVI